MHDKATMTRVRDKLVNHLDRYYDHFRIRRSDLEAEGLGLRPLTVAENLSKSDRNVLARRYYRMAQWNETLQGNYWLTVRDYTSSPYSIRG